MERRQALLESGEEVSWDFTALPVQADFLTAPERYTMFSGAFACGKTTVLCAKIIGLLMGVHGNMGYMGRQDGKALSASTLQTLLEMLPSHYYTKNEQKGFLKIRAEYGGSKLFFGDFKDLNDLKNIPLGFFAIDQAEEVSEEVWKYLAGRLRRKVPILAENGKRQYIVQGDCIDWNIAHVTPCYAGDVKCRTCGHLLTRFTEQIDRKTGKRPWDLICYPQFGFAVCNPEGPSHWIYRYFSGLPGAKGQWSKGTRKDFKGFHADIYDGLSAGFIQEEYVTSLERLYEHTEHMRERYLLGHWVEAEGLVYPAWDTSVHALPRCAVNREGQPIFSVDAPAYEYIDHGLTAPTAVGWVVVETCRCGCDKLNYYVVAEHYEGHKTVSYHAQQMRNVRASLTHPVLGTYLDGQAFSKTLMGQKGTPKENELYSVADEYMEHGIYPVPNQKDWQAGYNRIGELLLPDPSHAHPVTGEPGAPHLFAFSHCTHFIDEICGYKWKKVRGHGSFREEPSDKDDHHMDGLNGLLTSRPSGSPASIHGGLEIAGPRDWEMELTLEESGMCSHMAL